MNITQPIHWFAALVFACVVCIYNLHYYLKSRNAAMDERTVWIRNNKAVVIIIMTTGVIAISFLLIKYRGQLFNLKVIYASLLIPLLSLAYSFPFLPGGRSLRHIGWLKLPLLSAVWSFVTVWLPVLYSNELSYDSNHAWLLFLHRYIFIMSLAMLFNIRDAGKDASEKIQTPAVVYGTDKILRVGKWVMLLLNCAAAVFLIIAFRYYSFPEIAALFAPVVLIFLLFHYFRPRRNEIQFSVLHDGLMPVKALLLIFAT